MLVAAVGSGVWMMFRGIRPLFKLIFKLNSGFPLPFSYRLSVVSSRDKQTKMRTSVFITLSCVLLAAAFTPAPVRPCVSHKPFRLSAQEALPGFSTAFSENGLDYFTKVGLELLSQKLKNLTIPSISGIASVTIVGDIQYNITQLNLGELDFSNSQLDIVPGVGLSVTVKRALSSGSFNWHWEEQSWPHIHGTGTADFTFVLSLNMQLAFSAVDDHLQLKTVSPTVSIDDLEISTSGINR
ncbi:bactericidal permeability increasing protein-like [Planoprotostelium fungivorum]|uniref:Bactericidal permeability increasing protein-like n=1 Tax=Planoprotostelium fungivorum TaxID=1890364 RepID=A0A2P6NAV6_9EUKA|nr:bactericidal permeability increasing protein-like [Planoprotostelium fungivorum]